jgi:phenylacetate-CoA ligase
VETEKYWNPVLETMPREGLEKLQLKRFRESMKYAMDYSPFYKRKYEEAGIGPEDIKTLDDVRKVPMIDKSDLKSAQQDKEPRPYGELLGVPDGAGHVIQPHVRDDGYTRLSPGLP